MSDPGAVEAIIEAEAIDEGVEQRTEAWLAGTMLPERVEVEDEAGLEPAAAGTARPPHDARFQFFTGALIAVAVAALFLLGGFLLGERDNRRASDGPTWSEWRPTKDGAEGAKQIATRVGREYRLSNGSQLVLVEGGELEIAGLPLTVAMRQDDGDVEVFDDEGVLYRLCGLGENCAITTGKPSPQRHLLLRRQALELALYSFRYLDDVEQVVVFMPPKPGDEPSQALFFRRDQMQDTLAKPLEATLVARTPTVARVLRSPDTLLVEQLTIPTLFRFSLTQANQDDRAFLVLEPFNSPEAEKDEQAQESEKTKTTQETGDSQGSDAALGG